MHQCPQNAGPKDAAVEVWSVWEGGIAQLQSSDVASCELGIMLGPFLGSHGGVARVIKRLLHHKTHIFPADEVISWEKRESRLGPNGFPPHASLMIRSNIEQPHATMDCTTWTAQVTFPTSRFCQSSLKLSGWNADLAGSSWSTVENPRIELRTKTSLKMKSIFLNILQYIRWFKCLPTKLVAWQVFFANPRSSNRAFIDHAYQQLSNSRTPKHSKPIQMPFTDAAWWQLPARFEAI